MNKINRNIFIGDIHWCFDEFMLLLQKLDISKNDLIFLTWDLISKWPKSLKVLKYIYKHRDQFIFVKGNKEFELLEAIRLDKYYSKEEKKLWTKLQKKYPELLRYIEKAPYYFEHKSFLLIHAWKIPGKTLAEHSPLELCYLRDYMGKPWYEYYTGKRKIIYGHWAVDWLKMRENSIWLDSWCVYGWELTAYILDSWDIVQIRAQKLYKNPFKIWSFNYYCKNISFTFSKIFKWK